MLGFRLPSAAASVRLRVVDAGGRIVRDLADGPAAAGEHTVSWDGRNAGGRSVPAGMYFYVLEVDGRTVTTRPLVRLR